LNYRRSIERIHKSIVVLCALVLAPVLHAQQGASALPEPLRNIPRAGESCKNELLTTATQKNALTGGSPTDLACVATSADARELPRSQAMVIDVRHQSEFQRYHVPGSINLPARSLAYKPALRSKEVLLMGDGRNERELYSVCGLLKQSGFLSVRVVAGGMISYLAGDLPVSGRAPASHELARIDAAQLWAEGQFAGNLLVVADRSPGYSDYLPYAVAVASATPPALAAVLDRHRREIKKPVTAVVLVGAQISTESSYKKLAASIAPVPLLFYADSASALKNFVSAQKAIWAAHARGPKQPRCG
jgi:rhodanese-related sulfurtransferase